MQIDEARYPPTKPNVVFIYADDIGIGDFSCYGATALNTTAQSYLLFMFGNTTVLSLSIEISEIFNIVWCCRHGNVSNATTVL